VDLGAGHVGGGADASKQGAGSGARHLLWGGREQTGDWIWCQAPAGGRPDASKLEV
jgi:hypothetical protein